MSLLQYMKNTTLDNQDIVVKDNRIKQLDAIVQEVKQSEEWEAVRMNIYETGKDNGREEGIEIKLIELVCKKLRKGKPVEVIADELEETVEKIQAICDVAAKYAPDYDEEEVCKAYL